MAKKKKVKDAYFGEIEKSIRLVVAGKFSEPLNIVGELLRKHPERPEGYFALGLIVFKQGDEGRATELINRAHSLDPDCREYVDALAVLYTLNGKLTDGLYFAKLATALEPNHKLQALLPDQLSQYYQSLAHARPSVHYVKAMAAYNSRDFAATAEECERELRINKENADACRLLAKASLELANYRRADEAIKAAIALTPDIAENYVILGDVLFHCGDFPSGIEAFRVALDRDGDSIDVATAAVYGARFLGDDLIAVQADFLGEVERRVAVLPTRQDASLIRAGRRDKGAIRVGYLSNSLFDSDLGHRIQTLLSYHDRQAFEIYVYQMSISRDAVNVEITVRAHSHRNIYDLDDDVVATIIGNDQIDVLVDLCGFTEGNRLGVVATGAAPVQVGFLQYPYGFRVPGVNFVLSDPVTAESDGPALGPGQESLRLDYGLVAVSPYSAMQDVHALPARKNGFVTFGGLADLAHLSPDTVAAWAGVLKAVPNARLLLGNVQMVSPMVRERIGKLFAGHDIGDRIGYFESQGPRRDRQEFFHRVDVLLDTVLVCGETSLCEGLWMGVPVLSLKGGRRSSQIGASILYAAGKPQWACATETEFVGKAASLAEEVDALAGIRSGLRDEVAKAALFNPRLLMASLETAFADALRRVRGDKA